MVKDPVHFHIKNTGMRVSSQSQVNRASIVIAHAQIRERTERALRRNTARYKKQRMATQKRIDLEKYCARLIFDERTWLALQKNTNTEFHDCRQYETITVYICRNCHRCTTKIGKFLNI